MRKILKVALPILAIALGMFGLVSLAQASFWITGVGFHYSPDYGDLGDGLEANEPFYETPSTLGPDSGTAFSAGYDFSKNWGIRLDTFSFTGIAEYHRLGKSHILHFKTSTSPTLLSIVYRFPTKSKLYPYLGAGIGSFPSELTIESNIYKGMHCTDSPTGYQVLAGAEYRFKGGLFFSGELKYLSAEAEYPNYRCLESCSTDWSGIFVDIGIGCRF